VSIVYVLRPEDDAEPISGDVASETSWHPVDDLPELAFDHSDIINRSLAQLEK